MIAIIVSVVVIVVVLIIGVLMILYLRKRRSSKRLKLKIPDFKTLPWKGETNYALFVMNINSQGIQELIAALLNKNFSLAEAFFSVVTATEIERISKSMIHFYFYHDQEMIISLIKMSMTLEINSSKDTGTLFRSNSAANRLFTVYSKIIGLKYLWETLALPVNELALKYEEEEQQPKDDLESRSIMAASFKMDRIEEQESGEIDAHELAANTYLLLLTLTNMFARISKSYNRIPPPFITILCHLYEEVKRKFSVEVAYKSMGAFLFLRFIGPAISAPHLYGLLSAPAPAGVQKTLILITKMIQNLANESLPGKKQAEFSKMDEFVTNNIPALHGFYDKILSLSPDSVEPIVQISEPQLVYENAIGNLYNFIVQNRPKLESHRASVSFQLDLSLLKDPLPTAS